MTRQAAVASVVIALVAIAADAQTISTEADFTAGYSGEEIRAAASQVRVFGEAPARIGFFAEAAWGDRWIEPAYQDTDAFGAAYPYRGRVIFMEAYAERFFSPRGALFGLRAGRFRTPFGISSRSDYGYTGFLRPPLLRYDGYFAVSNSWLEDGIVVTAGRPQLFVEASVSRPHDVGSAKRRAGTDESIRLQAYRGQFIFGVSHARSNPYLPASFAIGRQTFTGIDVRWAHPSGVQARGEALRGQSFTGVRTTGWYIDGQIHRPGMGPVTAVLRGERLDYTAPSPRARSARRVTAGARVRLPGPVTVQVNYLRQRGDLPRIKSQSIDVGATYSIRMDHR